MIPKRSHSGNHKHKCPICGITFFGGRKQICCCHDHYRINQSLTTGDPATAHERAMRTMAKIVAEQKKRHAHVRVPVKTGNRGVIPGGYHGAPIDNTFARWY